MKKTLLPLIIASMTVVACQGKSNNNSSSTDNSNSSEPASASSAKSEYDRSSLSIVTPTGAPALAFYNYAGKSNFETNSNPSNVTAYMAAGSKDVVILPTNAGVKSIIDNKSEYKIAATITFGNFYVASLNNDDNGEMDPNDKIVLFQRNNVPDKIFHYVYGDQFDSNIYYANAVDAALNALVTGQFSDPDSGNNIVPNYVMIAEPALTNALSKNASATVYADLQAKYKEKSGNKELFQASVFIKNSVDAALATLFLDSLKNDIEEAIADPSKLSAGMNKESAANEVFGVAPTMVENVLRKNNGMGLGFKSAKENKEAIETFLSLFNMKDIDEKIYF